MVFAATTLVWFNNALASVLRGGGNMLLPSAAVIAGVAVQVPLSPVLIYGWGPVPGYGMAGAGYAIVTGNALIAVVLVWSVASGQSLARFALARLRWPLFADILRVGAAASVNTLQTTLTVAIITALVARSGGPEAVAGYGTGSRLEYLLVPLVFGLGAPLVALVGTNVGAHQRERALRVAMIGGGVAFLLTETVGLAAAIWPHAWLGLFGADPVMLQTGTAYLRRVGPTYGFYGLGLALYFASQGAGRMVWPLADGHLAAADRSGRRMDRPAAHRLGGVGVPHGGTRHAAVRYQPVGGHWQGCLVPGSVTHDRRSGSPRHRRPGRRGAPPTTCAAAP